MDEKKQLPVDVRQAIKNLWDVDVEQAVNQAVCWLLGNLRVSGGDDCLVNESIQAGTLVAQVYAAGWTADQFIQAFEDLILNRKRL